MPRSGRGRSGQAFDDEAHVHHKQRCISLKLASANEQPPKLLADLQALLLSLDIKSYGPHFCERYVDGKGISATKWAIQILHQDNLTKFLDKIGFDSASKNTRLTEIVASLKQPHFAVKEKPAILLAACKKIQAKSGHITSAGLAAELNRSKVLAKKALKKMRINGTVKLIKEKIGNSAAEYALVV